MVSAECKILIFLLNCTFVTINDRSHPGVASSSCYQGLDPLNILGLLYELELMTTLEMEKTQAPSLNPGQSTRLSQIVSSWILFFWLSLLVELVAFPMVYCICLGCVLRTAFRSFCFFGLMGLLPRIS